MCKQIVAPGYGSLVPGCSAFVLLGTVIFDTDTIG